MNNQPGSRQPISVLVYPWDYNPYQGLLYGAMSTDDVRVASIKALPRTGPLPFLLGTAYFRGRGYRLLHLHWPNFNIPWPKRFSLRLSLWSTFAALAWARALGYCLIWTVHDLLPHEPTTSDDRAVARQLASSSAAVIVHSTAMLDRVKELGASNVVIIPHGSYVGAYPSTDLSPEQARATVGVGASCFVFLFFGLLRPYKGVPTLVRCFLEHFAPEDRLVVAGLCLDPSILASIPNHDGGGVIFHNERIPDSRVSTYYRAAHVACLPFEPRHDQRVRSSCAILRRTYSRSKARGHRGPAGRSRMVLSARRPRGALEGHGARPARQPRGAPSQGRCGPPPCRVPGMAIHRCPNRGPLPISQRSAPRRHRR